MSAEENKEINKAVEELDKLSQDPKERERYEEREWSIMRYNAEMETNRKIGEKIGEERGKKIGEKVGEERGKKIGEKVGEERGKKTEKTRMIKRLFEKNMKIDEIAEIVELSIKEVENVLKNGK